MIETHTIENEILLGEVCSLLAQGKSVKLRAKGESMRPFIRGDIDTLLLSPVSKLKKGHIVLAKIDNGTFVVHRIIRITADEVYLAGDGNLFLREKCLRINVAGVVKVIFRKGREYSMISPATRLLAFGWRMTLPFRQLLWKIKHC